jgi:hypothetical protein
MGDQHSFANRIAFAFVAASAGVQALQQALKDAPELVRDTPVPDLSAGNWNYVPLVLVSAAALVWLSERMFKIGENSELHRAAKMFESVLNAAPVTTGAAAPPTAEDRAKRAYVADGITYGDLVARVAGKTDLQKQALIEPYLGKWMRTVGVFDDVTSSHNGSLLVFLRVDGAGNVACSFAPRWRGQITAINVGDIVTIDGKLASVTRGARFKECEILDIRPAVTEVAAGQK